MELISTRGKTPPTTFTKALFQSMAPDGGLFTPKMLPPLASAALRGLEFRSVATTVAGHLLGDEIDLDALDGIVEDALDFPIPLVDIGDGIHVLELFHGPTLAF